MIPDSFRDSIVLKKSSKNRERAELFGAFDNTDTLTFLLTTPRRLGVCSPRLEFFRDIDGAFFTLPLEWRGGEGFAPFSENESYILTLPVIDLCRRYGRTEERGLFYYSLVFDSAYGTCRMSFDDMSYKPALSGADYYYKAWQLTVYEPVCEPPTLLRGGIMYHIFVDRFRKAGKVPVRSDAVFDPDWEHGIPEHASYRGGFVRNNGFFGGTLYGVVEKLDRIKSLGVNVIYLSPIFEAYSNHKYDTGDYEKVDEMFGGDEAFDLLISEAKKRDISVILDGVFNHTGSDSRYFNKNGRYKEPGAYQSRDSKYYKWFDFESYPDKYRCWWGVDILPAVNTGDPGYREYITGENGIVRKYLRRGIAGWRLDVADELSQGFLEELTKAVKAEKSDAVIIGEVWEDASCKVAYDERKRYFQGRQLDSVMNYPLREGILNFIREGNSRALRSAVITLYSHYPKFVSDSLMNFLGTHDTERVLTVLGTNGAGNMSMDEMAIYRMGPDQRATAVEKLKAAYALLAFMPGIPCVYYGDEAGMEGFCDPFNRMPYVWGREDRSLLSHYRKIGRIRRENSDVLSDGYLEVDVNAPDTVFVYSRIKGSRRITVAVNAGEDSFTLSESGISLLTGKKVGKTKLSRGAFAVILSDQA